MGHQRFCRAEEWPAVTERLKLTSCPHCKAVGTLIRHGQVLGYDESSGQITLRARRIFCSNRNARPGCGRTFSVWLTDKVRRRLHLTASALWRFIQLAVAGTVLAAGHATDSRFSDRTWQRVWRRFNQAQCHIRTALHGRCPPPDTPPQPTANPRRQPAAQVLAHLQAAFPDNPCPIAAFQHTTQTFFM